MSMTSPDRIELNQAQQQRLRHLIRAGTTTQQLAQRARIVLLGRRRLVQHQDRPARRCVRGHRSQVAAPLVGRAGYGVVG
jgi:hypothetical protein